jgi:hypothetical protein
MYIFQIFQLTVTEEICIKKLQKKINIVYKNRRVPQRAVFGADAALGKAIRKH